MANTKYKQQGEAAAARRKEAGLYVRRLREKTELTQRELAMKLNFDYYTFISQVESGAARVPPESMELWAKVLEVPKQEFAKTLLRHYDPHMFEALYG